MPALPSRLVRRLREPPTANPVPKVPDVGVLAVAAVAAVVVLVALAVAVEPYVESLLRIYIHVAV